MGYNSNIFLLMPKMDTNALAFILAHESATSTSMDGIQKQAINNLFLRLKGVLPNPNGSLLYSLLSSTSKAWIHAPSNDTTASLSGFNIELFSATSLGTFNNFVSGDATPNGLTGNTTTKYFDSGITMASFPTNTSCIGVYARNGSASSVYVAGCYDGSSGSAIITRAATGTKLGHAVNATAFSVTNASSLNSTGLVISDRSSLSVTKLYKGGSNINTSALTSVTPNGTVNLFFHAFNNNGTPGNYAPNQLCSYFALSNTLTANEHSDLNWIMQNYNTEIITGGRQV